MGSNGFDRRQRAQMRSQSWLKVDEVRRALVARGLTLEVHTGAAIQWCIYSREHRQILEYYPANCTARFTQEIPTIKAVIDVDNLVDAAVAGKPAHGEKVYVGIEEIPNGHVGKYRPAKNQVSLF